MKTSTLDYLLLGLLLGSPGSGYDLRKWIGQSPLRVYSDSPGAIYPALRRLAKRGWVRAEEAVGGRRRRIHEATDAGTNAFMDWLHLPVERQDVVAYGEELLLRFAFMGPMGLHDLAKRFLEQYEKENAAYLETLRRYEAEEGENLPLTGRLTFEFGMEQFEARIQWTRRSLEALETDSHRESNGGSP